MALFDNYKISSTSEKMRFLACEQIERALKGIYPHTKILPFGSSVNSFGKRDSDLDMFIDHNQKNMTENSVKKDCRLIFHSKGKSYANKLAIMNFCSFALQRMLPGCQVSTFLWF